jgi:glycosyltransferase involved in cell wall biosynthesis
MRRYVLSRAIINHAASGNIAVSRAVSRHLVDRYRADPSRVTVIYNVVRSTAGSRLEAAVHPEAERRDIPPTVVSVGRLSREKGVDILLDAMAFVVAQMKHARLIIVGDGPERPALERRSADLGIADSVRFVGYQTEISDWLSQATVLAMPSRSEGMGMSAAEALAHGVPVVCSNAGGLPEVVEDGRCGTVVAGRTLGEAIEVEPRLFAEALLGFLNDRDRAQRLGRNGREIFEARFTEEEFLRCHVETYLKELELTERRHARPV